MAPRHSKLDEGDDVTDGLPLDEESSDASFESMPLKFGEGMPEYASPPRRRRWILQRSLQIFAVVLWSTLLFIMGVAFSHKFHGVDEHACLDTAWGKTRARVYLDIPLT